MPVLEGQPLRRYLYLQPQIWHFYGACGCVLVILCFILYHAYWGEDAQQVSSTAKSRGGRNSDRGSDGDGSRTSSSSVNSKKKDASKSRSRGLDTLRFIASLHMVACLIGNYSFDEENSSCRDRITDWDNDWGSNLVPTQEKIAILQQYTQERVDRCDVLSGQMYFDTLSHYPYNDNYYVNFLGRYGFTWAPWFMMLSGFLLTLPSNVVRINDNTPGSTNDEHVPIETIPWQLIVYSKIQRIYPLYITCYILVCIWDWKKITAFSAFIDVFLLQAWLPWTEYSMIPHAWYLSCMIPLWSIHVKLLTFMKKQSTSTIIHFFVQFYLYVWLVFGAMWPLLELTYLDMFNGYVYHHFGELNGLYDVIETTLKYNPIFYLPTYAAGVALAVIMDREHALAVCSSRMHGEVEGTEEEGLLRDIREKMEANGTLKDKDRVVPKYVYEYGTSIGIFGLLSFFCSSYIFYNIGKYHYGGKHVYEILLFANNDPMFGFRLGMLLPLHCLTICGLAYHSPLPTKDWSKQLLEIPLLSAFGLISYSQYIFQFIFLYWWSSEEMVTDVFLFCVAASIGVTYLIDLPARRRQWFSCSLGTLIVWFIFGGFMWRNYDSISPFRVGPVGYEQRIGSLWTEEDANNKTGAFGVWMNPVIHKDSSGTLWIAARKHHITWLFNSTNFTVPQPPWGGPAIIWNSDIGVSKLDPETMVASEPMEILCDNHRSKHFQVCKRYDYMWSDGPEDPRFIFINDEMFLSFVGPIRTKDQSMCVTRQHIMKLGDCDSAITLEEIDGREYTNSKNWMYMGLLDEDDNYLFMIDAANSTVYSTEQKTGKSKVVSTSPRSHLLLDEEFNHLHGGSNMVRMNSVVDGKDILMTVVHTGGKYVSYFLEYEIDPPYTIRRVSRPLPLSAIPVDASKPLVFASGLTKLNEESIAVSYGVSDTYSFVSVYQRDALIFLFDPKSTSMLTSSKFSDYNY